MGPQEVLEFARKNEVKIVDIRFTDLPGLWHHVSFPIHELTEQSFEDGFGIDGSSIRGWASIHESDMLLVPDPTTAFLDPFRDVPTLVLIGDVVDPITRQSYPRDPRFIARKAEAYLGFSGIADQAFFGAEAEFFIFDSVRFDQREQHGFYFIDAEEGRWNSGRDDRNLGYRPRYKEGYFPVPPTDHYLDLRTEMALKMEACGLTVECHHHEVATGGQAEIDIRFDTLLRSADNMMKFKYIVRNVAYQYGKTVTFMPKPIFQDNGNGMHTHQSLWRKGQPLFAGDLYAGLSQTALWYIGGRSDSHVLAEPQSQAPGIPAARPFLQPLPGVCRDADGRTRRHRKQNRSRRAPGQGYLRSDTRGAEKRPLAARLARRSPGGTRAGPRVPAQGGRLHRRSDPAVDRLQDEKRGAGHPDAPAPLRVPALLRHLVQRRGPHDFCAGTGIPRLRAEE